MTVVADRAVPGDTASASHGPPSPVSAPEGSGTATGPTVRSTLREARGPLLVALALVLAGIVVGVLSATGSGRRLDPDSYAPAGSRAVAEVLRDTGVPVQRVETLDEVEAADAADRTVVVPVPQALAPSELERLSRLDAGLLVVGAEDEQLSALGLPAEVRGQVDVEPRRPACELPAAAAAGDVDLGGRTYRGTAGAEASGCYAAGGDATLLRLPGEPAVLLGDGALLTNDRLDERGNAALALALLGERDGGVLWLVPRPGRPLPDDEQPSFAELLPDGLLLAAVQLLVAAGVLALWRARRLGRVVEEPLPVVVRAAETVEGRSRLYRAAGARGAAADALRAASRERLVRRAGATPTAPPEALVAVLARRTGRDAASLDRLLYGGAPVDDGALVRLADDLQELEAAVSTADSPADRTGRRP